MKKCQLYLYNDIIYMVPTASCGKMYSQIIEPFLYEDFHEHESIIGKRFYECLNNCVEEKVDTNSMNSFNKFLDLTKLRTNKNLLSKAKYIHVTFTGKEYIFKPLGANFKHKVFMEKLSIEDKHLQIEIADEFSVGKLIRNLFLEIYMNQPNA